MRGEPCTHKGSFYDQGLSARVLSEKKHVYRGPPFDRLRANGLGPPFVVSPSNHERRLTNCLLIY